MGTRNTPLPSAAARVFHITVLLTFVAVAITPTTGRRTTRFPHAKQVCTRKICREVTTMPHQRADKTVQVPVYIWYNVNRAPKTRRRLAIVMPGGLIRADEYAKLAARLSRRGITTVIPMYSGRVLPWPLITAAVAAAKAAGRKCPSNGVLASARLFNSVTDFMAIHMPEVSLHNITVIAHSFGGGVASLALTGVCQEANETPRPDLDLYCEGYVKKPTFSFRVLVMYEGAFSTTARIPRDQLVVHIKSFLVDASPPISVTEGPLTTLESETVDARRILQVRLKKGTNHFGPINYNPYVRHSTSICGFDRPPPEDEFVTTRKRQTAVIASVVDIIITAQESFAGGLQGVRKARHTFEEIEFVKSATFGE